MVNSKRRLSHETDDEEELKQEIIASSSQLNGGSQAKRAKLANGSTAPEATRVRPAESDEEEDEDVDELATPAPQLAPATSRNKHVANGNSRLRDVSMQADDDDGEGQQEDDEEDDSEEIRNRALNGEPQQKGHIAEAGVIDTVILKNFMCHPHMEVRLNPQINFIIGHNGSGKSVILTAITYAFGAKASVSNRGTSQNSFIRHGCTSCEVMLSLRNKGVEAYKPDVYGKTIWIIRRTTAEGSSSYKIADQNKKTVATNKKELAAICDHFNIQVDNPVNILHQDMAKLFLHSSRPTDKYRFFLKGTQLEQLLDEYQGLFDQTQSLNNITRSKKERLEELKEKMKEAQNAWKQIEQARNVENNIRKLKNELAWTHVVDIEQQTQAAVTKQAEEEEKIAKIGRMLKTTQGDLEEATAKLAKAEAEQADEDANDQLSNELKEVTSKIRDLMNQMADAKAEQREMQENVKTLREEIAARDKELEEAQSRADGPLRQKMMDSRARLQKVEVRLVAVADTVEQHRAKVQEMTRLFEEERSRFDTVRAEQRQAQTAMEHAETAIRNIEASQQNSLNRFGQHAAAIVAAIERERNWRQKPVGPIGNYIKIKDPHWAKTCEAVCGDRLNSFLVSNDEDRFKLNSLISRFRGARHNVIFWRWDDSFEASMQEKLPDRTHTTMLDVLSFEDQYVRQAFISAAAPEASVLVRERRVGDDLMRFNKPEDTGILRCFTMDMYSLGGVYGGSRMTALQIYRGPPRLTKDMEADRQRAIEARQQADVRLREANQARADIDRLLASYTQQKKQAELDASRASKEVRDLQSEKEKLSEEAQDFAPADVTVIENAKREAQEELDNIKAQGANSQRHVQDLQASCTPYVHRKEEIKRLMDQREMIRASQAEALEGLAKVQATTKHEVTEWTKKQEAHNVKLQVIKTEVETWAQTLQDAMDQAGEMCAREDVEVRGKSVRKLEAQIASLEKALRQQEARLGGSSEEIHNRYIKAKENYQESHKAVQDLKQCAALLLEAYSQRMYRWTSFRTHLAMRARIQFIKNLAVRNCTGELRFKHDENKLELRVQPNADDASKTQRSKDISTLSGGEKSFSTICLLLALWTTAGCPIRGLDEYDVFMDAVNRKIATNMLVDAGHASNNTQMILISPQTMQSFRNTEGVKVIRIADPERGQGTLATNSTSGS